MSSVLLISTNRSKLNFPPFPLGLAYLVSSLKEQGHKVNVLDIMFKEQWEDALKKEILAFNPKVIGLSIRNIDNQNSRQPESFLPDSKRCIQLSREVSSAKIVVGGSGFSIFPQEVMEYLEADIGIIGEGEFVLNQLLQRMESSLDYMDLPGVVVSLQQGVLQTQPHFIERPDQLSVPERGVFDTRQYYKAVGTGSAQAAMTIQGKRGCHLKCIYCSTPFIEGREIRYRNSSKIVDELELISKDLGFKRILFVDSLFNYPLWHAKAICKEIIARSLDIRWGCLINPSFIDEELFLLLKKSGCAVLVVGNESGCDAMLRNLKKGFTQRDIERCLSLCDKYNIKYNCFLLLGGPGETRETVKESVEFLEGFSPNMVTVTIGIRLYPHCELEMIARKEGLISQKAPLLPAFYLSEQVKGWIDDYISRVAERNPLWQI